MHDNKMFVFAMATVLMLESTADASPPPPKMRFRFDAVLPVTDPMTNENATSHSCPGAVPVVVEDPLYGPVLNFTDNLRGMYFKVPGDGDTDSNRSRPLTIRMQIKPSHVGNVAEPRMLLSGGQPNVPGTAQGLYFYNGTIIFYDQENRHNGPTLDSPLLCTVCANYLSTSAGTWYDFTVRVWVHDWENECEMDVWRDGQVYHVFDNSDPKLCSNARDVNQVIEQPSRTLLFLHAGYNYDTCDPLGPTNFPSAAGAIRLVEVWDAWLDDADLALLTLPSPPVTTTTLPPTTTTLPPTTTTLVPLPPPTTTTTTATPIDQCALLETYYNTLHPEVCP